MRSIVLLLTLALAACASYSGAGLRPGEARLDDVVRLMGQPALRWQDPDGSIQLAYPRGPEGFHTYMVRLAPDGRLQSKVNVLDAAGLAKIRPGMTQEQVLRVLGPPNYSRTVYFKARDELVWDWRTCINNLNLQRLYVLFDATSGAVRSTMLQDELFGREGITIACAG